MDSKRVLIVEPDTAFALSLASLFQDSSQQTEIAASAAEAERAAAARTPDLVLVRAELPDDSGFSLVPRLRDAGRGRRLPVVLFSSDASQEAMTEHARTGAAADGYLGMPLDTEALMELARELVAAAEPQVESADDAILVDGGGAEPVPPLPRRSPRTALTAEDHAFLDRTFASVAERRGELLPGPRRSRTPPEPGLLATPEGRLEVLREDLRAREAQIARLSELWEVREREVARFDDRLHERDVELQRLRLDLEELQRRLAEAHDLLVRKEREHGAEVERLVLEKLAQEKELVETIAAGERRIHDLERDLRLRDDEIARGRAALDGAAEEIGRLERRMAADAARFDEREQELQEAVAGRETELAELERRRAAELDAAEADARRHQAALEEAAAARRARQRSSVASTSRGASVVGGPATAVRLMRRIRAFSTSSRSRTTRSSSSRSIPASTASASWRIAIASGSEESPSRLSVSLIHQASGRSPPLSGRGLPAPERRSNAPSSCASRMRRST
jgi:ParB family chromosome partitioning protein